MFVKYIRNNNGQTMNIMLLLDIAMRTRPRKELVAMPIYSKPLAVLSGLVLFGLGFIAVADSEVAAREKQSSVPSVGGSVAPLYGFRLPDIDGHPVDLKTFKGKVLLIVALRRLEWVNERAISSSPPPPICGWS
jgi:hypothetical protein